MGVLRDDSNFGVNSRRDRPQDRGYIHRGSSGVSHAIGWSREVAWKLVLVLMLGRFLAVDVFPIITNDSLAYLFHSDHLLSEGLVRLGYRQVGYPALLALVDYVADVVRMEPLFLTSVAQRVLLAAGLGYGAWLWKWRVLPLAFVITMPEVLAYTNFLLTEGISLGLGLILGVAVAHGLRLRRENADQRTLALITGAVTVAYLALVVIRFHYILLAPGVVALLRELWLGGTWGHKAAIRLAAAAALFGGLFLVGTSIENANEYDTFFPTTRGERSQYWAAWQISFSFNPENKSNPRLADHYADGDAYSTMRRVDALPTLEEQQQAYEQAIQELFDATGTSVNRERIESAVGVLRGGRIDDVAGLVRAAVAVAPDRIESAIHRNAYIRQNSIEAFEAEFNSGESVAYIVISPLSPIRAGFSAASVFHVLAPMALVILLAVAYIAPRESAVGLVVFGMTAAVVGYFLLDNLRFLVVHFIFCATLATAGLDVAWLRVRGASKSRAT